MLNKAIIFAIALTYNIFIHHLTSLMYKDLTYNEKYTKSLVQIIIAGIFGIIIAKIALNNEKNEMLSSGLFYGGILLVMTGIILNWEFMEDKVKLLMTGGVFFGLVWFTQSSSFKKFINKKDEEKKN